MPVAVVSNETSHDRNEAFTNNNKLITYMYMSKYVFRSFSYYPANIKLTWNYGEAHHFKGMLNWDEIVYYTEEVST